MINNHSLKRELKKSKQYEIIFYKNTIIDKYIFDAQPSKRQLCFFALQ
jgi:hypothetical protein